MTAGQVWHETDLKNIVPSPKKWKFDRSAKKKDNNMSWSSSFLIKSFYQKKLTNEHQKEKWQYLTPLILSFIAHIWDDNAIFSGCITLSFIPLSIYHLSFTTYTYFTLYLSRFIPARSTLYLPFIKPPLASNATQKSHHYHHHHHHQY